MAGCQAALFWTMLVQATVNVMRWSPWVPFILFYCIGFLCNFHPQTDKISPSSTYTVCCKILTPYHCFRSTSSICSHLHSSMTVQLNLWLLRGLGSQRVNTVDQVFSSRATFLAGMREPLEERNVFTLPLSSVDTAERQPLECAWVMITVWALNHFQCAVTDEKRRTESGRVSLPMLEMGKIHDGQFKRTFSLARRSIDWSFLSGCVSLEESAETHQCSHSSFMLSCLQVPHVQVYHHD